MNRVKQGWSLWGPFFLKDISLCLMVSFTFCMGCPNFFYEDMEVGPNLIISFGLITSKLTLSKYRCLCLQYILLIKCESNILTVKAKLYILNLSLFFSRLATLSHDTGDWRWIVALARQAITSFNWSSTWNAAVPCWQQLYTQALNVSHELFNT